MFSFETPMAQQPSIRNIHVPNEVKVGEPEAEQVALGLKALDRIQMDILVRSYKAAPQTTPSTSNRAWTCWRMLTFRRTLTMADSMRGAPRWRQKVPFSESSVPHSVLLTYRKTL